MDQLVRGPPEALLDRVARPARPGLVDERPAALEVGLEDDVADALDHRAVALLAGAQARLGLAAVGRVDARADRADRVTGGVEYRAGGRGDVPHPAGRVHRELGAGHGLALERAEQ